jgi:hypothetical protein
MILELGSGKIPGLTEEGKMVLVNCPGKLELSILTNFEFTP